MTVRTYPAQPSPALVAAVGHLDTATFGRMVRAGVNAIRRDGPPVPIPVAETAVLDVLAAVLPATRPVPVGGIAPEIVQRVTAAVRPVLEQAGAGDAATD